MVRRRFLIIWFVLFNIGICLPQNLQIQDDYLQDPIEDQISTSENEIDASEIYEDLYDLIRKPVNLNTADEEELDKLHVLTDFQKYSLLEYRKKNGSFVSLYELQLVYGFTPELIQKISPYITLAADTSLASLLTWKNLQTGKNEFLAKSSRILEKQMGYLPLNDSSGLVSPNNRYLGNPWKIACKYKYDLNNRLFLGLTAEKDPGEEFFKGINKKGFDFYSAFFQINNIGKLKRLCIGDYNLGIGQGLILWSGFSLDKSPFQFNLSKSNQGIRYSSSFNESGFLRGAAATLNFKNLEFTIFSSFKKPDANITNYDSVQNKVFTFSSFQESGLHNTANLAADKHSIEEFLNGSSLTFRQSHIKFGINLVNISYNADYVPASQPYNYYKNIGRSNWYTSCSYQLLGRDINFFGEAAWQLNNGYAFVNGLNIRMGSAAEAIVLHRYYARNYFSPYSSAFGENTSNSNEKGLYSGITVYPVNKIKISAFYDLYKFPWLKYLTDAPSNGSDFMIQTEFNDRPVISMYFRYRCKKGVENSTGVDTVTEPQIGISQVMRQNFRYQLSYRIYNNIYIKNRLECLLLKRDKITEKGFIFQDINYKFNKTPLTIYAFITFFSTDSYQSRIYCYENDLLYDFSVWSYYDKGMRTGIMIRYDLKRNYSFQVKLSQDYYPYSKTTGTGLNQTDKNTRTEVKGQVIIKF